MLTEEQRAELMARHKARLEAREKPSPKRGDIAKQFPKQPVCEICEKEPADRFVNFHEEEAQGRKRGWVFGGKCLNDQGHYEIEVDRFFDSPAATVDWIAHMHEKTWMNWQDFAEMMDRFRDATKSYGQL